MNGHEVFKTAIKVVLKCISEILTINNRTIDEIKFLIPHQPSIKILQEIAKRIKMPFEKVKLTWIGTPILQEEQFQ